MAKKQLDMIMALFFLIILSSCQSQSLKASSKLMGMTMARVQLPAYLPGFCTAKVGRAYPKVGEKARWTQKRWEMLADHRDDQAAMCIAFWHKFRSSMR